MQKRVLGKGYPAVVGWIPVDIWYRRLFPESLGVNLEVNQIEEVMAEARLLIKLRHPSILQILGTVTLMEGPALVMERSVCSIASCLRNGPVPVAPAIRIMAQITSVLAYLHGRSFCCTMHL